MGSEEEAGRQGMGVAAQVPPLSHPFGAEPVPVSGKAGIANAGPWNAAWWRAVLRDLHNFAPGFVTDDEYMPEGFTYPGFNADDDAACASLIAAAPELLAALEAMLASAGWRNYSDDDLRAEVDLGNQMVVPILAARAALRKANGEAA